MSGECSKCAKHILECKCAGNACEMANKIYEAIYTSDPKIMMHAPDAIVRVFVYLARKNDWTLEQIQKEVEVAIKYYFSHEKI